MVGQECTACGCYAWPRNLGGSKVTAHTYSFCLGDAVILTESDVAIPHLLRFPFPLFPARSTESPIVFHISQIELDRLTAPPFDASQRQGLLRTVNFPPRWLDSPAFLCPPIQEAALSCLEQPEMAYLQLAWNRIVIRDFVHRQFFLFYSPEHHDEIGGPMFEAGFRNMVDNAVASQSSVMIHAAGIVRGSKAALFMAEDAGGKSTVVAHSVNVPVLNDDQVLLRRAAGKIVASSTPFGRVTSGPQQARLGGLFLLEKAEQFSLTPVQGRDVIQYIWHEHQRKWPILPRPLRIQAFEMLCDACHQVPCYRMRFPKDSVDWDAIDAAMAKSHNTP